MVTLVVQYKKEGKDFHSGVIVKVFISHILLAETEDRYCFWDVIWGIYLFSM